MEARDIRAAIVESGDLVLSGVTHVAGTDLSFWKDDSAFAVAALVVCTFPELRPVWLRAQTVFLAGEYTPGFLAQREAQPLLDLIDQLRADVGSQSAAGRRKLSDALAHPGTGDGGHLTWFWREHSEPICMPQALLVDGCGVHHHFRCGLASHLGVRSGIPSAGVAKSLLAVHGIRREIVDPAWNAKMATVEAIGDVTTVGQHLDLVADTGEVLGRALRTFRKAQRPVYVSVGSGMCLDAACALVVACCRTGSVPVPIQQADHWGRQLVAATKLESIPAYSSRGSTVLPDAGVARVCGAGAGDGSSGTAGCEIECAGEVEPETTSSGLPVCKAAEATAMAPASFVEAGL
jgi:deoxyribonuclease V